MCYIIISHHQLKKHKIIEIKKKNIEENDCALCVCVDIRFTWLRPFVDNLELYKLAAVERMNVHAPQSDRTKSVFDKIYIPKLTKKKKTNVKTFSHLIRATRKLPLRI